jgi:hypothetical protein
MIHAFVQRLSTFDLLLPPMPASAMPVRSSWVRDGEEEHQKPLLKVVRDREARNEYGQTPWLYPTPVYFTHARTHASTHARTHTHTHTHIGLFVCMYVCIYIHTYIHMYICTYITS